MKKILLFVSISLSLLIGLPVMVLAQTASVSGKVTDSNNEPLIGVNIVSQGNIVGTVTDLEGEYILEGLPAEAVTLMFSYIGYTTKTLDADLSVNQNQLINVTLSEEVAELDEVVVIGYGVQKKSDLTSAISSISAEDLEEAKAANIQEALQGLAAGVHVSSNTGAPGAGVSVKIRGITSINGTDPLWIIDGVAGDPNSVNAADIESMEILKDASSAAIYGANAGSGVILVTTKKGKAGDTKVTFNAYQGMQKVTRQIELASGPEFTHMLHEYEVLANKRKYFSTQFDTFDTYNYQDMIFQEALMQNYDVGVSGGNEKSTFYMGASYSNQEGILKTTGYERLTVRLNGEHKANDWFTVGFNTSFSQQKYKGFEEWELQDDYASPILNSITFHNFVAPYIDPQDIRTDSEYDKGWSSSPLGNISNPVSMIELKNRETAVSNASGTFFGKIMPVKGLTLESRITGSMGYSGTSDFYPVFYVTNSYQNAENSLRKNSSSNKSWNWQNLISYNASFQNHNLSVLAGFEAGYGKYEYINSERHNLINQSEEMRYYDAALNDSLILLNGLANESSGYSYLGRVSYDYRGMILGQFNIRKDYSSKFGPQNRSGVFPSWSVGFKFTELEAVKNALPFMNFGKARFGWGKVGNNSVIPYQYFTTVYTTEVLGYSFNNSGISTGVAPFGIANPNIRWEDVITSNLGLDLRFLTSRLSTTIEYFERHNNGMLMVFEDAEHVGNYTDAGSISQEGGRSYSDKNIGQFNNSGVEFDVGWKDQRGMVKYGANFNFTYIKTSVGEIEPDTLTAGKAKGLGMDLTRTIQNQPFDIFYGYITDGLFQIEDTPDGDPNSTVTNQPSTISPDGETVYAQPKAKPGDFRFKDVNGDGKINEQDMVSLGSPHPKFAFALNLFADVDLPANLGTIDFRAFFQGVAGNKVFNATKFYLFNKEGAFNWGKDYYDNHYTIELYDREGMLVTEANDDAKYPRLDPTNANENFMNLSDFYIENASYLRLKNLEIGYTLPESFMRRVKIERLRVYGAVKNLFTLTEYSGLDPEVGGSRNAGGFSDPRSAGIDKASYPVSRMWTIGVNVNF